MKIVILEKNKHFCKALIALLRNSANCSEIKEVENIRNLYFLLEDYYVDMLMVDFIQSKADAELLSIISLRIPALSVVGLVHETNYDKSQLTLKYKDAGITRFLNKTDIEEKDMFLIE